jgi:hypothetical protein
MKPADAACVLWMQHEGEIYSPKMPLERATFELIARDLWNGAYPGICHSVLCYGAHANGGGYCREITQDLAARLGEMSFSARDEMKGPVRAFLEAMGVPYRGHGAGRGVDASFEMVAPPEPVTRAKRAGARKRAKPATAAELRAQPQLKLPIAGGRHIAAAAKDRLVMDGEHDDDAGVESMSLKDTRSLAEQRASWERFRAMVRSWRSPAGADEAAGPAQRRTRKAG